MFYSVSRAAFALVLVLALAVSAVPAQAQPHNFEPSVIELEGSWLDAIVSWFQSFLPGDELSVVTMGGGRPAPPPTDGGGNVGTMSTSCIDPMGNPCVEIIP